MSRYCLVNKSTGSVENEIVWDGEQEIDVPEGYELIASSEGSGIGGRYDFETGRFDPPTPTE